MNTKVLLEQFDDVENFFNKKLDSYEDLFELNYAQWVLLLKIADAHIVNLKCMPYISYMKELLVWYFLVTTDMNIKTFDSCDIKKLACFILGVIDNDKTIKNSNRWWKYDEYGDLHILFNTYNNILNSDLIFKYSVINGVYEIQSKCISPNKEILYRIFKELFPQQCEEVQQVRVSMKDYFTWLFKFSKEKNINIVDIL